MSLVDKIDGFMAQIYFRISGAILFVLVFIMGYLYHIYPNPVILTTLLCMVAFEVIGLDKINLPPKKAITKSAQDKPTKDILYLPKNIIKNIGPIRDKPGFIYVMIRQDGIIKIGQTNDTARRQKDHIRDYNQSFKLVKRFAVPDKISFEKLALRMTKQYKYQEKGRQELRQMNEDDLYNFLAEFLLICRQGVDA